MLVFVEPINQVFQYQYYIKSSASYHFPMAKGVEYYTGTHHLILHHFIILSTRRTEHCANLTGKSWSLLTTYNPPKEKSFIFTSTATDGGTGIGFRLIITGMLFCCEDF